MQTQIVFLWDSCPPPTAMTARVRGPRSGNFPRAKAAHFCRRMSGPSDGRLGHISCCILWVQESGLSPGQQSQGMCPAASRRAAIKGPVAVQRAACLAQVPGLSADLNVDVTHEDIELGGAVHRPHGKIAHNVALRSLFKKCNVADHNKMKSDRERSRKPPLSLWDRGLSVAQVKRIWGFQLTGKLRLS